MRRLSKKRRRYPWNAWFKKRRVLIKHKKDFDCQPHGMAQQIRNEACKRGISVSISIDNGFIAFERV
ncbi:hypothetical protein M0R72_07565 [Candidatus Pacearchaeota archaeon]|jgi:hypothetical protein|nr:hypothetical protein [Candidatus Pacearchaeota archaeon]